MIGSEPMIIAEAFASDDSALIFSRISLRERSTAERLPSASERLPPVFCWIVQHDGEEVHFRQRHALVHALQRLIERHAHRMASHHDLEFGAAAAAELSRAMMRRHSLSGRPDFTPRTMTSMASASWLTNFFWRPPIAMPSTQRGRPKPADESRCRRDQDLAAFVEAAPKNMPAPTPTPITAEAIQNVETGKVEAGLRDPVLDRSPTARCLRDCFLAVAQRLGVRRAICLRRGGVDGIACAGRAATPSRSP